MIRSAITYCKTSLLILMISLCFFGNDVYSQEDKKDISLSVQYVKIMKENSFLKISAKYKGKDGFEPCANLNTQCGFKAIARQAARELLPQVENNEWFFDTELLLLAEKGGYRVKDVPVHWIEDTDSRVNVRQTVLEDLQGLARMRFRRIPRRAERQ